MTENQRNLLDYIYRIYISNLHTHLNPIPSNLSFDFILYFPHKIYEKLPIETDKATFIQETESYFDHMISVLKRREEELIVYSGNITLKDLEPKYNNPSHTNPKYRLAL